MAKRKWRAYILMGLVLAALICGSGAYLFRSSVRQRATEGRLCVHFIDVGQGDAALLTLPDGKTAMIDTGTEQSSDTVIAYLKRWGVEKLDWIFLSHLHSDHIGGLNALCEAFEIGQIYYTERPPELNLKEPPLMDQVTAGDRLVQGDVAFTVLAPITQAEDENNNSMILRIEYGEIAFLFTGDAEEEEEAALVSVCPELLDADVLKIAHHGSATSTSDAFVQAVMPQVAVASASADNSFGHPVASVIAKLQAIGCTVFSTHREGSIVLICDGQTVYRHAGDDYLGGFELFPDRRWFCCLVNSVSYDLIKKCNNHGLN